MSTSRQRPLRLQEPSGFLLTPRFGRPGFSVIAVLAILSVAVVLSYALLHNQATSAQIGRNASRQYIARQAAESGLNMAIRRMHHSSEWGGVSSVFNQTLSDTESFTATYTAGDPELTESNPDWEDYPYRVTIDVKGTATDPFVTNNIAFANLRAVVRLMPVAMPDELTDWNTVLQYTIYQTDDKHFELELPTRIEGSVRMQGELFIAAMEPDDEDARNEYLDDLNNAMLGGEPDYRPFNGPIELPFAEQDADMLDDLTVRLGVTAVDVPVSSMPSDWDDQSKPNDFSTYQIYAGGPVYSVESLPGSPSGAYDPNPLTNPLGLFTENGNLTLENDVSVRGTLIVKNKLCLEGTSISLSPVDMLPLHGSSDPVRMPTVLADELQIFDGTTAALTGLAVLWDRLLVEGGTADTIFDFKGHLVVPEFEAEPRTEWEWTIWSVIHWLFGMQDIQSGPTQYFPLWLDQGVMPLSPLASITFKQDPQSAKYHWKNPDPNQPIYIPRTEDAGLFWEILRVEMEP